MMSGELVDYCSKYICLVVHVNNTDVLIAKTVFELDAGVKEL